jgi:hypothetical protein
MIGIQPEIQLLLLSRAERNSLRYFRDAVPDILNH